LGAQREGGSLEVHGIDGIIGGMRHGRREHEQGNQRGVVFQARRYERLDPLFTAENRARV